MVRTNRTTPNRTKAAPHAGAASSLVRDGAPGDPGRRARVTIRDEAAIRGIAHAGVAVRAALDAAMRACVVGATTRAVEDAAREALERHDAEPLFLYFPEYVRGQGFPATTCVSVDDAVVHGVPGPRRLRAGQVVSIDVGARVDGWCHDASDSLVVGPPVAASVRERAMVRDAYAVLEAGFEHMRPGRAWSSVAEAMESAARTMGYGVVAEYVGHGIGRALHEQPAAPAVVTPGLRRHGDFTLRPGMVLAIEPALVLPLRGERLAATRIDTFVDRDGWTVRTAEGRSACHVERTVAIDRSGVRILTPPSQLGDGGGHAGSAPNAGKGVNDEIVSDDPAGA